MEFYEERVETELAYRGQIVNVRRDKARLQNGNIAGREVVEHPGGVGIVPVTQDNEILMVRQFRYPLGKELLEIPAGKLAPGEDPLDCAVRELSEETGCTAGRHVFLGEIYPTPGYCEEKLHIYLALDLEYGKAHLDENELLCTEPVPMGQLVEMIMRNELPDAKSIIGVMKAKMYMEGHYGKNSACGGR